MLIGADTMQNKIDRLYFKMIEYFEGDPKRIQHFIKVHSLAKIIGSEEGLDAETQLILEATALLHDVGIKKGEELYGECNGKIQEELGPDIAKSLLIQLQFTPDEIERICFIIGHHHTYNKIDGVDFQILVEADFMVNMYEDNIEKPELLKIYDTIFKTETGKDICRGMFHIVF